MNVNGNAIIATISGSRSLRRPSTAVDHRSPNRWIAKIDAAIALARSSVGTVRRNTALTGDVDRNSPISQTSAMPKNTVDDGTRKHTTASGAAMIIPTEQIISW